MKTFLASLQRASLSSVFFFLIKFVWSFFGLQAPLLLIVSILFSFIFFYIVPCRQQRSLYGSLSRPQSVSKAAVRPTLSVQFGLSRVCHYDFSAPPEFPNCHNEKLRVGLVLSVSDPGSVALAP